MQVYSVVYTWDFCVFKCRNQFGQYKAHCGHYAKPFGTTVLSFCRVEISIVLTQEFSKLHFQECFKIKISSCICTFSANTVSWTLVYNASVFRVGNFLVLLILGVVVMHLSWQWLWCLAEGLWAIRKFSCRSKDTLLVHSHWNVTRLKFAFTGRTMSAACVVQEVDHYEA